MNLSFKTQDSKLFCLLLFVFCLFSASCSMPNLQSQECSEARPTVKEFYSYHFGNDMKFTLENLKLREKFLTPELINKLTNTPQNVDPFTLTNDTPKAFRVGGCEVVEEGKNVNFEVLLFWKTDTRSEQRSISVEVVKQNDKWLINKIFNK